MCNIMAKLTPVSKHPVMMNSSMSRWTLSIAEFTFEILPTRGSLVVGVVA
jgi:hypothetical protein